ncbi:chemotaxis response regulator protein-glutamate methylesterase [bacterium]|nr:chemotaxis response regulator protein-glutamate methylesterase [bacterium]
MIKVLIVDDSSFMRQELTRIISSDPQIEVIGTAFDGVQALKKAEELKPDVITLDIEMPQMDGLTALKHIMISNPTPVVIISSITQRGAEQTLEAMRLGAIEIIAKPSGTISLDIKEQSEIIKAKIKAAANVDCAKFRQAPVIKPVTAKKPEFKLSEKAVCSHIIAIGVSTGGPNTLLNIIPKLPADLPACVLIVQHMPPVFTKSFADRLNNISNMFVTEASDGNYLRDGTVYVAPGGLHMTASKRNRIDISEKPGGTLHRPSVDVMMNSVADVFADNATGVILTGMGKDGAKALKKLHDKGAKTIGESKKTAVVYGMPREAYELGAVDYVLDNNLIYKKIIDLVNYKLGIKK